VANEHLYGAVAGSQLQVCEYRETTCCTSEMESTMRDRGLSELLRAVAHRVVLAKKTFLSRAAKFDGIQSTSHNHHFF